jgi:hypothetical protein
MSELSGTVNYPLLSDEIEEGSSCLRVKLYPIKTLTQSKSYWKKSPLYFYCILTSVDYFYKIFRVQESFY